MANHTTYVRDTGWKAPLTAQGLARRQGWNDALDGAPPDRRLMDHADKHVAMSYERGRLFATQRSADQLRYRLKKAMAFVQESSVATAFSPSVCCAKYAWVTLG